MGVPSASTSVSFQFTIPDRAPVLEAISFRRVQNVAISTERWLWRKICETLFRVILVLIMSGHSKQACGWVTC